MNRVLVAARLHLANPLVPLGIPALVVLSSFAVNLLVWAVTPAGDQPGGGVTGGITALYVTVLIFFAQSITQLLPFGMSLSLTRRTFYLGCALVAAVESLAYGVVLTVLETIEGATGGWGLRLHFWAPGRLDVDKPLAQVFVFAAPMLTCCALGLAFGVVLKRWGQLGLWTAFIALGVALTGALALIGYLDAWAPVFDWLGNASLAVLAVGVPVAVAAAAGLLGYAGVRRVVP